LEDITDSRWRTLFIQKSYIQSSTQTTSLAWNNYCAQTSGLILWHNCLTNSWLFNYH